MLVYFSLVSPVCSHPVDLDDPLGSALLSAQLTWTLETDTFARAPENADSTYEILVLPNSTECQYVALGSSVR